MSSAQRVVAFMLSVLMAGCASIGDVSQLKLTPWPPPTSGAKKTVAVTYGGGVFMEKGENKRRHYIAPGALCRTIDEIGTITCAKQPVPAGVVKAFQDSGLFSEIKTDGSPADIQVTVKSIVRNQENPGGVMLVAFTMFFAPGKVTDHYLVTRMTFKDREGKVLGKFEGKASRAQWLGLLSLFGLAFRDMPFAETEDAAYRAILIEARQKGVI